MKKTILFDLDGTLTDSGPGILNSVELALRHFSLPIPSREALQVFVGPPLRDTFISHGVPANQVEEAIRVFRSYYHTKGIFENAPYPGIPQLLRQLYEMGYTLCVATSKPEPQAVQVLEHFDLAKYFRHICGATLDGSRDEKSAVIAYLLQKTNSANNAVMVGDTHFDVLGAAHHSIPTLGVSWGYGSVEAMLQSGASAIANTPQELFSMLTE